MPLAPLAAQAPASTVSAAATGTELTALASAALPPVGELLPAAAAPAGLTALSPVWLLGLWRSSYRAWQLCSQHGAVGAASADSSARALRLANLLLLKESDVQIEVALATGGEMNRYNRLLVGMFVKHRRKQVAQAQRHATSCPHKSFHPSSIGFAAGGSWQQTLSSAWIDVG